MITLLEGFIGTRLDIIVGSKLFSGLVVSVDAKASILLFKVNDGSQFYININLIEAVKAPC